MSKEELNTGRDSLDGTEESNKNLSIMETMLKKKKKLPIKQY